jgi:hypothetical protein
MADIYWTNTASGYWNVAANWSVPSGETVKRVPNANDIVYFTAAYGTAFTVSYVSADITVGGLVCTGFLGTIGIATSITLTVKGNVTLSSTTKYSVTGGGTALSTLIISPSATVLSPTVTTNNAILGYDIVKFTGNTTANIFTLVGALNCTKTFVPINCRLNFNGNLITCAQLGGGVGFGTVIYDFGGSGTSEIVIAKGGATNTTVVNLIGGVSCTASVSGSQRPVIRLTYAGAAGNRIVVDSYGAFDYIWSGSDPISLNLTCKNLDLSGFTGTVTMAAAVKITGDLTFSSAAAKTKWVDAVSPLTFNGTGTQNINTQGVALGCPVTFAGTGPYVIANNTSMGSGINKLVTLTSGTLNLNGKTFTVTNFNTSNSNVRGVTFASGKIVITGTTSVWVATVGTNLTITGPGEIELTNTATSTRFFAGGGVAYNGVTLVISGAATGNTTSIQGSNSFYSMINTISPQRIWFEPNSVTIFTDNFQLNGTAGKNITISSQTTFSTLAAAPKFAKPSGNVVCSYANIIWNTAGYTGSAPTSTFTSTWTTGVGSVLTPNQTSGWTKSAGSAGFLSLFYP